MLPVSNYREEFNFHFLYFKFHIEELLKIHNWLVKTKTNSRPESPQIVEIFPQQANRSIHKFLNCSVHCEIEHFLQSFKYKVSSYTQI